MHYTEDVHFNNNREGYLVKGLVEGIYSDSRVSLSHLKQQLTRFDQFYDGSEQRDANECFGRLMDVFHHGTRENPLDDLSLIIPGDDQFIHSLTKRLFLFNLKHTVQCLKCRLITTSYSESRNHFI